MSTPPLYPSSLCLCQAIGAPLPPSGFEPPPHLPLRPLSSSSSTFSHPSMDPSSFNNPSPPPPVSGVPPPRPERRCRRWSLSRRRRFFPSLVTSPIWSSLTFFHPCVDPSSFRNPSPSSSVTGVPPPQPDVAAPKPFSASPTTGHHGGFPPTSSYPAPYPHHTRARAASPAAPRLPASLSRPHHHDRATPDDRAGERTGGAVSVGPLCRWAKPKAGRRGLQCGPTLCTRVFNFPFLFIIPEIQINFKNS
jgi:hypothetical protein